MFSVTQGEFSKRLFVHSASVGVGAGVVIGLLKIVYNVYLFYLILPIYAFTCFLTYYSSNAMAHIAWDAGAITTGPVTVPLIMGIGYVFEVSFFHSIVSFLLLLVSQSQFKSEPLMDLESLLSPRFVRSHAYF